MPSTPSTSLSTVTSRTTTPPLPKQRTLHFVSTWALPLLLVAVVIAASIVSPQFLGFDNIRAILINTSIVGILAIGMTPITLSGNLFSMGTSQSTVFAAVLFLGVGNFTGSIFLGIVVALVVLSVVGVVQGLVVAAGLNPIITTLAFGAVIYGLVTVATGGNVITPSGISISWLALSSFLGLPLPVYIFLLYLVINWLLMEYTIVGRRILLIGANKETALNSGISVRWTTTWAFLFMSVGIAIAGVLSAAQLQQVQSSDLSTLTMDVVAAVLVGGTAIQGGDGSPLRSALGALLVVVLTNIMLLLGLPTGVRLLCVGLLVVIVVSLLHTLRKATVR